MKTQKQFIVLICFLIGASIISWSLYYKTFFHQDTIEIHNFPHDLGEWQGKDLPVSKEDIALLETTNVFVRRYTNSNQQDVYLFIVYSQNNRKVSHPPEVCYTGSGVTIVDKATGDVLLNPGAHLGVNRLVLEKKHEQQLVFYWFKVGDTFTSSYWHQQMLIAWKSLLGRPAGSALIRLSITISPDHPKAAFEILKEFTRIIHPLTFQYLP